MSNFPEQDILLDKTKGKLFFKRNSTFIAALICNLKIVWDETIDTANVDGVTLRWNPHFFMKLDAETRVTVLAHEAWHVAFQHMFRLGSRDPDRFNQAADHVINLLLEEHGYFMDGFPYLMDKKFKNMATEQVYELLPPEPENESPISGDIVLPDEDGQADSDEAQAKKAESMSKVITAATVTKMTGQEAGDIPGEIQVVIDKFLNPKLPWERLLRDFFNELVELDYSYRRPNRRYTDPILPGLVGMTGLEHLIYYLDISGSISDDDILRFNSEVKYIKDELNPKKLTLVTFDTRICDEYVFEEDDEFEKIVVTGRGGTNLEPVFKHAKEHNPNAMVIFTDLYVNIPKEKPVCPLVWICLDHKNAKVPYGNLIHMEDY